MIETPPAGFNLSWLLWKRSSWLWSCVHEQRQLHKTRPVPGSLVSPGQRWETCSHDVKATLLCVSVFRLLQSSAVIWYPSPLVLSLSPLSLQETPNKLCGVKRARWPLTCGAPRSYRSSRVTGRWEDTPNHVWPSSSIQHLRLSCWLLLWWF